MSLFKPIEQSNQRGGAIMVGDKPNFHVFEGGNEWSFYASYYEVREGVLYLLIRGGNVVETVAVFNKWDFITKK